MHHPGLSQPCANVISCVILRVIKEGDLEFLKKNYEEIEEKKTINNCILVLM